ncbi:Fic family protein [Flavobacterium salilacus subsp. salilacus]|uniref:Fic family protein n=1 Tax=Flavobacterium TaxID=237 RepID=UPI00107533B8|nr:MULTISPECIES: Fic family protein [Flavobacterium]KAF2518287.1 Fic family protein [Flavobacterium salilacus subsp. salilacus]MBE1615301.1 Fic family protein [Flavobacterium sp. SaA2.13]
MEDIIKAVAFKTELDSLRPIDKEQEARIMQKFRLDWNYHSNNLEGNSLTYGETKALLMHGITAQGKPLKDHFEITGHNEAINWVLDMVKGERSFTENFIRELHQLLLKESYEVDAVTADGSPTKKRIAVGSYKTTPNHVETKTGEIFYFATPEETPAKMADLMAWYNGKIEEEDVNPILLAAEFHYKFIRIHPFDDGNGRTARILMNFILMKFGYPPVIVKAEDKENYFAALRLADTGNIEAFVNYIAKNTIHSLEIMIAGAKGESIEDADDIDKEIALLEMRLAGHGKDKNTENKRTDEIVREIYKNTIVKIVNKIQSKLKPFEKYYINNDVRIYIDGTPHPYSPNLVENRSLNNIGVVISYKSIKKVGFEDFEFGYGVYFKFNVLDYTVKLFGNMDKTLYTKFYENLSDTEITTIVKQVVQAHNKELEKALGSN